MLQLYAFANHVLDDVAAPLAPSWLQMDNVVLSWIISTLTVELHDGCPRNSVRRQQGGTGSPPRRRVLPSLPGDLSISEYCRRMKGMIDSLRDLGRLVADHTLVLNLLCGLSPRYNT